jgi:hypothetical protein
MNLYTRNVLGIKEKAINALNANYSAGLEVRHCTDNIGRVALSKLLNIMQ